jgi:hypothetical protein
MTDYKPFYPGREYDFDPRKRVEEIREARKANKITRAVEIEEFRKLGMDPSSITAFADTDDKWVAGAAERQKLYPDHFTINLKGRSYEDRWTRYRAKVLAAIGLTDDEISALKYNRMTNPRVAWYLKQMRAEVRKLQDQYGLADYATAAEFRREHFVDLVDNGDIEESDPYYRMGYLD